MVDGVVSDVGGVGDDVGVSVGVAVGIGDGVDDDAGVGMGVGDDVGVNGDAAGSGNVSWIASISKPESRKRSSWPTTANSRV